jgi:succinate dehydrogenase hydrophobic anchor subunit
MGIFLLTQIAQPDKALWQKSSVNFGVAYWSTSVATNLLLTLLIVSRLIWMRVHLRRIMGDYRQKDTISPYLSISAMLVESAALYSAIAIGFIVSFARNSPVNVLFLPIVGQASVSSRSPTAGWLSNTDVTCVVHRSITHHPPRQPRPRVVQRKA